MADQEYDTAAEALEAQSEEANQAAIDARDENPPEGETEEEYNARIKAVLAGGIFGTLTGEPFTGEPPTEPEAPADYNSTQPVDEPVEEPVATDVDATGDAAAPVADPAEPEEEQTVVGPEGDTVVAPTEPTDEPVEEAPVVEENPDDAQNE